MFLALETNFAVFHLATGFEIEHENPMEIHADDCQMTTAQEAKALLMSLFQED